MGILSRIDSPADLQGLTAAELRALAGEIRGEIIRTVAANGGHLASSLGTVELILALHTVFATPRDKIVWDVGHQAYAHKILTGRREAFVTLRQTGGISGFPKPEESRHDAFATGHSSTSISAALGLALARDLAGEDHRVVAVIGDGALTGGLAFEGLSQVGHHGTNLLIVLNDNKMSIAPNVGSIPRILQRIRMNPNLHRLSADFEERIRRLPLGDFTAQALEKVKDGLKYMVIPGVFFEELGVSYFGPIDGHQIQPMQRAFREALAHGGPVLVHVLTKKGRGYEPAERNPEHFHGIGPFEIETGRAASPARARTYTEIFGQALIEVAKEDPRVVAITAAMPEGTGLWRFARRFPDRFFDVGIAEPHAVTLAAGLAAGGLRPVVAVYSTFLQRAYDQILHDVCLQNLPVIFALDRAGVVGQDGPTHHGLYDLAYLRHIPGIAVLAPKDERELRRMLRTALAASLPAAIRYPRAAGQSLPLERNAQVLPWGRAELIRNGHDAAILAVGPMVATAEAAADHLAARGLSCAVVNARFIKPLDEELLLRLAQRTERLITIEDGVLAGGFGAAVLELLATRGLHRVQVRCLGFPDRFIEQGPRDELLARYGLSVQGICEALTDLHVPAVGLRFPG